VAIGCVDKSFETDELLAKHGNGRAKLLKKGLGRSSCLLWLPMMSGCFCRLTGDMLNDWSSLWENGPLDNNVVVY